MPMILDEEEEVNEKIGAYEINSFAIDLDRQEIVIGYDKLANGVKQFETTLTVDGAQFMAAIGEANTIAKADVYGALKQALYSQITQLTGKTGSVD